MVDDKRASDYLTESVGHSIASIEGGIRSYVYGGEDSSFRSVATELRKLLVDQDAVASFRKSIKRARNAKSLFELQFGNGRNIFLKSFGPSKKTEADAYVDVTPDIYRLRQDILYVATHGGELVSLRKWLEEDLAYTAKGQILKVGTAIRYIAGKEGSHIINPIGDDREDVRVAFFSREPKSDELSSIDFEHTNPWRQFVIDSGMRLLSATSKSGGRLIKHSVDIPDKRLAEETMRIQKIRRKQ